MLFEPGDADALSAAILRLLRDPELGRTLGQHGRAHVARHFAAEVVGRSYIGLYQEALHEALPRIWIFRALAAEPLMTAKTPCKSPSSWPAATRRRISAHFLDSLLAQDMAGMTWEAIIADGMSDDGTREILANTARAIRSCAPSIIRGAWFRRA